MNNCIIEPKKVKHGVFYGGIINENDTEFWLCSFEDCHIINARKFEECSFLRCWIKRGIDMDCCQYRDIVIYHNSGETANE